MLICAGAANAQVTVDTQISRQINAGDIAAARATLERSNPSDAERAFFEGRVLKAQGRLTAAIAVFREIVEADPNQLNARRELAHSLLVAGRYGEAARSFRALLRLDDSPQMRSGYRRFLAIIEANRPFALSFGVSLLPSTNVNRGASSDTFTSTLGTFTLNPSSVAQSGVGVGLSFGLTARPHVTETERVSLAARVAVTRYSADQFNATDANLGAEYQRSLTGRSWSLAAYVQGNRRKDGGSYTAQGLSYGFSRELSAVVDLAGAVAFETRNYETETGLNGDIVSSRFSITRALGADTHLSAQLEVANSAPALDYQSYVSRGVFLGWDQVWSPQVQTRVGLRAGKRDFRADFPLTSSPREDRFRTVTVGVSSQEVAVFGLAPTLTCSHALNRSNVTRFDYDSNDCALSFGYTF